jgi:maltose/moltooligosaccharide transporter
MSFGFLESNLVLHYRTAMQAVFSGTMVQMLISFPGFWLVAPIVVIIVQPIVGTTATEHGTAWREGLTFFVGLIISIALTLLPNAGLFASIGSLILIGVCFLAIMDACINLAMEPFRALVADNLPDSQRTMGFPFKHF